MAEGAIGMFRGKTIEDHYREARSKIAQEVNSRSDVEILGLDTGEYADYLFAKHSLDPVEQDQSRELQVSPTRQRRQVHDPLFEETVQREVIVARVEIPIILQLTTQTTLSLLPSTQRTSLPEFNLHGDELVMDVYLPFHYMQAGEPPSGAQEINAAVENLQWWLQSRNDDIARLNPGLREYIERTIVSRKEHVARTRADFEALLTQVKIPLKLKQTEPTLFVPVPVRREIRPLLKPPTPKRQEDLRLQHEEVLSVVELISRFGQSLERTPNAILGLEEEDIRGLVLAQLNALVGGTATAETFSKLGKTDIHLNLPKGDILIAECKFWNGRKDYSEAIDQLFRYLTWRECYGIIIMFVRNKDFTNVLGQAGQAIQAHATYKTGLAKVGDAHFVSQHVFPDDPKRTTEVHHLFFHFPQ